MRPGEWSRRRRRRRWLPDPSTGGRGEQSRRQDHQDDDRDRSPMPDRKSNQMDQSSTEGRSLPGRRFGAVPAGAPCVVSFPTVPSPARSRYQRDR